MPLRDNSAALDLPQPGADAMAHSERLIGLIVERIAEQGGVIGFDDYMQAVLYEPGLGYYAAAMPKFGEAGDFVTAPEISPLFGHCLARQIDDLVAGGCAAAVFEFGAGSGRLCAQIMQASPGLDSYLILEPSADLKHRQQDYLQQQLPADLFARIEWLERLPHDFDGIVLANEVLDAMPVQLVVRQQDWLELGVGYDGRGFVWRSMPARAEVSQAMSAIESRLGQLPEGYRSELNLNYRPWMRALADSCGSAVVLIIDYGYEQERYYHPSRRQGTLSCHYRHRVHDDPFVYPGLQDITAFVDFDACADAAEDGGFDVVGLAEQGRFLLGNGLLDEAGRRSAGADTIEQLAISQQVATLSLPHEMGEKFKVLALQKDLALDMPALRRDRAYG
jgi:SAM-dependent MidA family methyltransferase